MKKIVLISMSLCFGVAGMVTDKVVPVPFSASQNTSAAPIQMEDAEVEGLLSSLEHLNLSESTQNTNTIAKNRAPSTYDLWLSLSTLTPPFQMISLDRSSGASAHPVAPKGAGKTKTQELTEAQVAALLFGASQNANTKEVYPLSRKTRNKRVMMGCQRRKENGRYFKKK